MRITILFGSPRPHGHTASLCAALEEEARALGHDVRRIDAAALRVEPVSAEMLGDEAPPEDGMRIVFEALAASDAVVFASPLYYYGMTAQLKTVLDRFFERDAELRARPLRTALLATAAGPDEAAFGPLTESVRLVCGYLNWTFSGAVCAGGTYTGEVPAEKLAEARALVRRLAAD